MIFTVPHVKNRCRKNGRDSTYFDRSQTKPQTDHNGSQSARNGEAYGPQTDRPCSLEGKRVKTNYRSEGELRCIKRTDKKVTNVMISKHEIKEVYGRY